MRWCASSVWRCNQALGSQHRPLLHDPSCALNAATLALALRCCRSLPQPLVQVQAQMASTGWAAATCLSRLMYFGFWGDVVPRLECPKRQKTGERRCFVCCCQCPWVQLGVWYAAACRCRCAAAEANAALRTVMCSLTASLPDGQLPSLQLPALQRGGAECNTQGSTGRQADRAAACRAGAAGRQRKFSRGAAAAAAGRRAGTKCMGNGWEPPHRQPSLPQSGCHGFKSSISLPAQPRRHPGMCVRAAARRRQPRCAARWQAAATWVGCASQPLLRVPRCCAAHLPACWLTAWLPWVPAGSFCSEQLG